MVGSTALAKLSVVENDKVRQEIEQIREEHARKQQYDYSHVFRKKSTFDFVRLSMIIMGIEFVYAAETAFISPILLSIGLDHHQMTLIWGISPVLGFLGSPLLGSLSDRCRSALGRRRPFILTLSVGLLLGLILAPYGKHIGELIEQSTLPAISNLSGNFSETSLERLSYETINSEEAAKPVSFFWALLITVTGVILLDFNADNLQTPSRAYLLDVCVPEDQGKALSTFTIMAGFGGSMGYALGAVDWDKTIFADLIGDNIRTVFALVTLIFIIGMICTVTSFREVPLRLMEADDQMRPVSQANIRRVKQSRAQLNLINKDGSNGINGMNGHNGFNGLNSQNLKETNVKMNADDKNLDHYGSINCETPQDVIIISEEHHSFKTYLKSIVIMPKSLRLLCLTNLLCWMSHICYCLYFTDFVGEAIFGGDPSAPEGSEEYELYDQGIRFGCWGMCLYALSCSIYSMVIERLIKKFKAKAVFVGGVLVFSLGMLGLAIFPSKICVLLSSISAGIFYSTIFTIPYLLVAHYHAKGSFKVRKGENIETNSKNPRGLAVDIAIISSMLFVGQLIMSLSIGFFITLLGSTFAIVIAASFFGFLAAISALFVVYMGL